MLVVLVIALVVLSLVVAAMVATAARDQERAVVQAQGGWAQYAAESAAAIAIKELADNADYDGDGGIGTVSNDGSVANDPVVHGATRAWATRSDDGGQTLIAAHGRNGGATRTVRVAASVGQASGASGERTLFYGRHPSKTVQISEFNEASWSWSSGNTRGNLSDDPIWSSITDLGERRLYLVLDSGKRLQARVDTGSGPPHFTNLCNDVGRSNSRPFHAVAQPQSPGGGALVIYYDKAASQMRYRTVSGQSFSNAASMGLSTSDVTWARLTPVSASSNQAMALVIDASKRLHAAFWNGSAWVHHVTLTSTLENADNEEADAAVEQLSGRVMVAFSHGDLGRFRYRLYTPGVGWAGSTGHRPNLGGRSGWIRLAARPGTDEIFAACLNTSQQVRLSHWNGTQFSTPALAGTTTGGLAVRGFDIAVSPDGSRVMAVYGKGGSQVFSRTWNGSAFGTETIAFTLGSGSHRTVLAVPGPSGGSIVGAVGDSNGGVNAFGHSGSAFGSVNRLATTSSSYANNQWFDITGRTDSGGGGEGSGGLQITGWSRIE